MVLLLPNQEAARVCLCSYTHIAPSSISRGSKRSLPCYCRVSHNKSPAGGGFKSGCPISVARPRYYSSKKKKDAFASQGVALPRMPASLPPPLPPLHPHYHHNCRHNCHHLPPPVAVAVAAPLTEFAPPASAHPRPSFVPSKSSRSSGLGTLEPWTQQQEQPQQDT